MKGLKLFAGLVSLFISAPIWYFLLYQVLVRVQADDLMWFLYWVYIPVGIVVNVALKIAEAAE